MMMLKFAARCFAVVFPSESTQMHRRRRSVRAKTDCNLSVLRKCVLDELRYDYPELNEQLFRVASQSENGLGGGLRKDADITSIDEEHVEPATKHDVHQLAARVDGIEGKLDQVIAMLTAYGSAAAAATAAAAAATDNSH
jgi:hypothetical protein